MSEDERFMRRALAVARRGKYTHPNPKVGAVIVKDGVIVGEGWHIRHGLPHAEAMAFAKAGDAARGATVYATLEPCSHYVQTNGQPRTPCTARCLDAGISRLVCAMEDPDSRVAGSGFAQLRDAGIEVTVGVCEDEAREMNRPYIKHRTTGLPWIIHKTAMTMDGKIATVTGASKWVTGEESRAYVHRALRNTVDAIVVGIGTVLIDDPSLTTRLPGGNAHQPMRVLIDSRLRTPTTAKVAEPGTLIFATDTAEVQKKVSAITATGAEVVLLSPNHAGQVDVRAAMKYLANERSALSILLEPGAELAAAFYADRLVDEAIFFVAPKLVGGSKAPSPIGGDGLTKSMDECVQTGKITVKRFGPDIALITDIIYLSDNEKTEEA